MEDAQRPRRTGWHVIPHSDVRDENGVRRGKPLVLLVHLQDMFSCAFSFGLESGFFPFEHHEVKEGLCFLTSCSRRSRSVRAFSRADWTSASLDSRD